MVNTDYILCSQRWRSSIQSAKTRPGADCGSDHELLIAKFRLIVKKVGKTTRPFRYDLDQIPYDYTMEVTIDWRDRSDWSNLLEELWTEVSNIVQDIKTIPKGFPGGSVVKNLPANAGETGSWHCTEGSDQDHPQDKAMQKAKWLFEEAVQIAEKRREAKAKEKRKDIPIWMQNSKE